MTKRQLNPLRIGKGLLCLLALFMMLLTPQGAWAEDYALTIAGHGYTASDLLNAQTVTGDGISGTVTITPASGTDPVKLTLSSATLGNESLDGSITTSVNLLVDFIGSNVIKLTDNGGYAFYGNGTPTLSFSNTGKNGYPLYVRGSFDAGYSNFMSGFSQTSVNIDWNDQPAETSIWRMSNGSSNEMCLMWIHNYDLWIGNQQLSSIELELSGGVASFDGDHTLTLNGISGVSGITTKIDNLIINLKGENSISGSIQYTGTSQTASLTFNADLENANSANLTLSTGSPEIGVINGFNTVTVNAPLGTTVTEWNDDVKNATIKVQSYDISVGGVTVTSGNAANIIGDNITGTVSFDASNNTLTLDNATLKHGISSGLTNLKIKFKGTNKVNTDGQSSTWADQQAAPNNAISSTVATATLTFEKDGNSSVELFGKTTAYYSVISGFASVSYSSGDSQCYLHTSVPSFYDATNKYLANSYDGGSITNATVSAETSYPLWFIKSSGQGTQLTSTTVPASVIEKGTATFNPSNNTLSLNGVTIEGKILSGLGNLTIDITGANYIATEDSGSVVRSANAGTLTIKKTGDKASLQLNSPNDEWNSFPVIQGFTALSNTGLNMIADEGATYGQYILWDYEGDDDDVKIYGLYNPNGSSKRITSVLFTTATYYPLEIAGNQVTSENADDFFEDGTNDKAPSVSFTPAVGDKPAILTLNNATIDLSREGQGIEYKGTANFTIKLIGTNSIKTQSGSEPIIYNVYPAPTPIPTLTFESGSFPCSLELETEGSNPVIRYFGDVLGVNGINDAVGNYLTISGSGVKYNTTNYLHTDESAVTSVTISTVSLESVAPTMSGMAIQDADGIKLNLSSSINNATIKYSVDYVDENEPGITDATYDANNQPTINKPATVTAYISVNDETRATTTGKYFGFAQSEVSGMPGSMINVPQIIPTIGDADGIEYGHEGSVSVTEDIKQINLEGTPYGKGFLELYLNGGDDTPYVILERAIHLTVNVVPAAPTIEYSATKTYLTSDKVSISLPESLVEDENASIKYSWNADCEPGDGSNYSDDTKVALNAGTNTLYAWVRYNGQTADDAVYSEKVSQEFTVKTDINQFAVKDLLATAPTYTGEAIVPTFTLYDENVQTNVLSADNYDVRIVKYMGEETGFSVVESIKEVGVYRVYAVGKGTTYGGEKLIYEVLEVKQADLPVTVKDVEGLTYTGTAQNLVTENNVPEGVTVKYYCQYFTFEQYDSSTELSCDPDATNFVYSAGVPQGTNAGVYGILYLVDGGNNYKSKTEATQTIWVTINPATITEVTLDKTSMPYSGAAQTVAISSVKAGDLVLGADDYTVTLNEVAVTGDIQATAVGEYTVAVTGQGNFTGTESATFSIVNRTLADNEVTFYNNWATYYSAVGDVMLPTDKNIGAFVATGIGDGVVSVSQISYIPKNVPVFLNNATENVSTVVFDKDKDTNLLEHTDKAINANTVDAVYYGLHNGKMMRVSGTIPAGKNYIKILTAVINQPHAPELSFVFEGDVTGVNDVRSKKADVSGDVYDLQGRKMQKLSKKGLYISNGRKVVVK